MRPSDLPSVEALAATLGGPLPDSVAIEVARRALHQAREALEAGESLDPHVLAEVETARLVGLRTSRVINATGVLLHTNMGRAPWPGVALDKAADAAAGYAPLELDLSTGRRGGRGEYVRTLLCSLTGAEDALAVNNNAGALLLALAAISRGGNVVVSRGELIEIGGSFRLPELMAASGARMVEVGTTNRTHLSDYEAVLAGAAAILKVHPSNYRIEGFVEDVGYAQLAGLAHDAGIPLVADVGSGLLDARVPWLEGSPPAWLAEEAAVRQTLAAGADVVLFSGDKLLGGPQAGLAVGSREQITAMARHPIARAVRCDGPTLAGLAAVLELYADQQGTDIPFWAMASLPYDQLEIRSKGVIEAAGVKAEIQEGRSVPGAGTVPGAGIATPIIVIPGQADRAWKALLDEDPPVLARRDAAGLVLDLRAVDPSDDDTLAQSLGRACR